MPVEIRWETNLRLAGELATFFIANTDDEYISWGEYLNGRATVNGQWSEQIVALLETEIHGALGGKGPKRMVTGWRENRLCAFAIIQFPISARFAYATLEDLVVQRQGNNAGIGSKVLAWIEAALRQQGISHLSLENGAANRKAQRFFRRRGYRAVTVMRLKPLHG